MTTRILVADDHAIVREGLRRILAADPAFVVTGEASDANEVMAAVRAGGFEVLLLDLSMPGRSGIELVKRVKEERPELSVLVLSMHAEQQYAVRAIRAGASGYLTKDTAATQLTAAIHKVASGGLFITPAVAEALALGLRSADSGLPQAAHRSRVRNLPDAGQGRIRYRYRGAAQPKRQDGEYAQNPYSGKDEARFDRGAGPLRARAQSSGLPHLAASGFPSCSIPFKAGVPGSRRPLA